LKDQNVAAETHKILKDTVTDRMQINNYCSKIGVIIFLYYF
jgi:hypothetical protein